MEQQIEDKEKLIDAYIQHTLRKGTPPASVFKLCKKAGVDETTFYHCFPNLNTVAHEALLQPFHAAVQIIRADDEFDSFLLNDKILALLYTTLEQAPTYRSFMLHAWPGLHLRDGSVRQMARSYRHTILPWVEDALAEGTIAARGARASVYARLFGIHFVLVIDFWLNDDSDHFQRTDAFVEKTVKLAMDLIGRQAIDSAFDLARFIASCQR